MQLLLIDNYDSFTYNLYQMLAADGTSVSVKLNDHVTPEDIEAADGIVISPGPGKPKMAGKCLEILREQIGKRPILGICLGHQSIVEALGGTVGFAPRLMHGKTSSIFHDSRGLFEGLPTPFEVGRYHSLIAEEQSLPEQLQISCYTREGEIMGVRHREFPVFGLQFHPESILTPLGERLVKAFLAEVENSMQASSEAQA